jgi:hypothetical protein
VVGVGYFVVILQLLDLHDYFDSLQMPKLTQKQLLVFTLFLVLPTLHLMFNRTKLIKIKANQFIYKRGQIPGELLKESTKNLKKLTIKEWEDPIAESPIGQSISEYRLVLHFSNRKKHYKIRGLNEKQCHEVRALIQDYLSMN